MANKNTCVWWVEKYFNDCVHSASSRVSFGLGLVSLACWGIAEIPQIVTNYHTKSGHGVSLGLLLTWVVGDIFNLVGCLLEPATLPTQFYTALLYTATTVVLVLQTMYYDYCLRWWKSSEIYADKVEVEEDKKPLNPGVADDSRKPVASVAVSVNASPLTDVYYRSARSLANSGTPPYYGSSSSYIRVAKSEPSASLHSDSSDEEDEASSPTTHHHRRATIKSYPIVSRSVGYGTFVVGSVGLPFQSNALMQVDFFGRELLQETGMNANPYGLCLGWIMACIYMGGRLPQIYLNIKRGSVEGLNPFMFMFALIANVTYVGSILVRSLEWERIKANAPWLLDAIVCVLLDLLIIAQFAYYKFMQRRARRYEDYYECYTEVKKPLV